MDENRINIEIEKTMDSIDNWQPLNTDDFFTTRTINRLNSIKNQQKSLLLTPILKVAIIATVFVINSASIGYYLLSNNNNNNNNYDLATAITNEYSTEGYSNDTNYFFE